LNTALTDKSHFEALADRVCEPVPGANRITLHLAAEGSDFIRFNHGAVRQATHVTQGYATLAVVRGQRRMESNLSLTGRVEPDVAALLAERAALLSHLGDVPQDPYLLLPDDMTCSSRHETGTLPSPDALIAAVTGAARGADFVGFYAGGPVVRAYADSRGQRHWHHVESFHFDWCLYQQADKAVKTDYAGTHWNPDEFARRVQVGLQRLPLLAREPRQLKPGAYRAYFAPAAMAELLGTLSWGGFGALARRTGTSSLSRLEHREAALHAMVSMREDTARGIAPAFTADGYAKPDCVSLIEAGLATGTLNSPRSARQYGLSVNGASASESPESLLLATGTLPEGEVLRALDTGLYVSNLWYLNYSDRQACRMTGMTRFACFWVEGGEPIAPLAVMRFDDSFLRMFGEGLVALADQAELIPQSDTYKQRLLSSVTTPGALIEGWRLTL
jgi:predicted Zn-dependent protease